MRTRNMDALIREREGLHELPEDIMERIQEFREEMLVALDDLEDMIAENGRTRFHYSAKKFTFNLYFFLT